GGDDTKDVVEVVGHASRKPSNRLHLLPLPQLLFRLLLRRDVTRDRGGSYNIAARVTDGRYRDRNMQVPSIFGNANRFKMLDRPPRANVFEDLGNLLFSIRRSQQCDGAANHLLGFVPVDVFRTLV